MNEVRLVGLVGLVWLVGWAKIICLFVVPVVLLFFSVRVIVDGFFFPWDRAFKFHVLNLFGTLKSFFLVNTSILGRYFLGGPTKTKSGAVAFACKEAKAILALGDKDV